MIKYLNLQEIFIYILVLFVGFIIGHWLLKSKPEIITKIETHSLTQKQRQTQANIQTNHNSNKQTMTVNIKYSPTNGKVTSKTFTETHYIDRSNAHGTEYVRQANQTQLENLKQIKQNPRSSLFAGLSVPAAAPRTLELNNVKLHLSWRVAGEFYLFGATNYNFSSTEVGFLIPLY
jgi:hypothetical protein